MNKLILGVLLLIGIAQAKSINTVKVERFDVSGIHLGMNYEEALTALKKRFPEGKIYESKNNKKIEIKNGSETISASFSFDYLNNNPENLVAFEIAYFLAKEGDNEKNLRNAMAEKYGEPTFTLSKNNLQWCENPEKIGLSIGCSHKNPILSFDIYTTMSLVLKNIQYQKAEEEALNKAKSVKKPNI